jgi:hypothetical protein
VNEAIRWENQTQPPYQGHQWYRRAKECKLRRGPFADQGEADSDAVEHAEALISALAATHLRLR